MFPVKRRSDTDKEHMSFQKIVEEIMSTHHSLLRRELPKISELIKALTTENAESKSITEAQQIFEKVRAKVEAHLRDEESVLFPTGVALETGGEAVPTEMNLLERVAEMEKEHDGCGNALAGVYQTIIDDASASELKEKLLATIEIVQEDFVSHVEKEDTKVHPMLVSLLAAR